MGLRPSPSLAYVAFYSDIEHEVLKVTTGYRITITYNLYLTPERTNLCTINKVTPDPTTTSSFRTTLQGLLDNPEFLPYGGTLGFGLVHLYPVTFKTELEDLLPYLKGEDAHVYRVCLKEFDLQPDLRMIYEDHEQYDYQHEFGIMTDQIAEQTTLNYDLCGVNYSEYLVNKLGGISVNKVHSKSRQMQEWFYWNEETVKGRISWISPFNERNQVRDFTMAHGNEVSVGYIYCSPCLIAHVPRPAKRTSLIEG